MTNILKPLSIALLLSGCSDPMLWQEDASSSEDRTRITSIEFVREACHLLTFNVGYFNDGSRPGYLRAGISAGVKDAYWPMIPELREGHHVVEVQAGIQRKAEPQNSSEVAVSIEHIDDNKWQGYVDKRTVEYHKEWDNDCR